MKSVDRRDFLRASLAVGATTFVSKAGRGAANDVIRVGVAGFGGRGGSHISGLENIDGVDVVALCDVDKQILDSGVAGLEKRSGRTVKKFVDVREMIADKDIDVITTATPNHWHALIGVWAMQAGKDVYVEKPCSHNVTEGRRLVEAARKYKRICQHGTQSRSSEGCQNAMEFLAAGGIGKVHTAKGLCYKWRPSIESANQRLNPEKGQKTPSRIDWNLWQGPAQEREYSSSYVHYNWHWFWDFGNGDIGNQGVHEMDKALWGLGKKELPTGVLSAGGRFGYKDGAETPNTLHTSFDYGDCQLQFEVRGLPTNDELGVRVGNIFYGSEGYLVLNGGSWTTFFGNKNTPGETSKTYKRKADPSKGKGDDHFANFIEAVRSRKPEDLNAEIIHGHLSSALCHLANISYRLGRKVEFDPKTETFGKDKEANQLLTRDYRSPFVMPTEV